MKKDGWQFNVEMGGKEVVKTPKTAEEAAINVEKYLKYIGKGEELDKRVKKILEDIETSTKIIKESGIPLELLANLEFLEDGKVKQTKVTVLGDKLKELDSEEKTEEINELLDKSVDFLIELWKYRIHEYTFKFHSNLGILDNKIVLIDPFELTDKKEKVEKQIKNRKWEKNYRGKDHPSEKIFENFNKLMDKKMTVENLNKNWGILR